MSRLSYQRDPSTPRGVPLCDQPPHMVVGYDVTFEVLVTSMLTKTIQKHWRGTQGACRRKAYLTCGYVRIVTMEPVTAEQWIRAYGDGRM